MLCFFEVISAKVECQRICRLVLESMLRFLEKRKAEGNSENLK